MSRTTPTGRDALPRVRDQGGAAAHALPPQDLRTRALRKGERRVCPDEEREALLTIKRGERPWPDVNAWHLRLHKEFDEAFASTQLPERPDYAWTNEFLLKARRQ